MDTVPKPPSKLVCFSLWKRAKHQPLSFFLSLTTLLFMQCARGSDFAVTDSPIPSDCEKAMEPNTRITAISPIGTIQITSGTGLKRSYTWDGETRSVEMWPRTRRWMGSKGIYFPGPGEHWKPVNGLTRGVVQEGVQNFSSNAAAMRWIADYPGYKYKPYRSDGLCVWWDKNLERSQLSVDVFQILIKHKKPRSLPYSDNAKILVETVPAQLQNPKPTAPAIPIPGGYGNNKGAGFPAGDYLDGHGKPLRP
jgi:hypothetical protein